MLVLHPEMMYFFPLSGLYRKGLIYLDVPIADDDCIIGR